MFLDRAPTTPHADLQKWRRALAEMGAIGYRLLVPGHGPAESGGRAIAQTLDYLDWLEQALTNAIDCGLSSTEAMALPMPPQFDAIALAREEFRRSVVHLFGRFEEALLPIPGNTTR